MSGASANDANHISGPSRTGRWFISMLTETLKIITQLDIGFISSLTALQTPFNDDGVCAFDRAGLNTIP